MVAYRHLARAVGLFGFPLLALATPASAREYKVDMANRSVDGAMVFAPGLVKVAPGDTVMFVVRDKSHNAESIAGLTPVGARPFKGRINEEIRVRFTTPGLYGYKCLPHLGMGMVGIVQVGAPTNRRAFEAGVAKLPPLARARFAKYLRSVR
jgi:pseudoazurin